MATTSKPLESRLGTAERAAPFCGVSGSRNEVLTEIEQFVGRWSVGPAVVAVGQAAADQLQRRRQMSPRNRSTMTRAHNPLPHPSHHIRAPRAATAYGLDHSHRGRSVDYIVKQMCEHLCEPIQSTGRILPREPGHYNLRRQHRLPWTDTLVRLGTPRTNTRSCGVNPRIRD